MTKMNARIRPCVSSILIILLSVLSTFHIIEAIERFRAVNVLNQKQKAHSSTSLGRSSSPHNDDDVQELYITQPLDHFSTSSTNSSFQQRYFYSDRFIHSSRINPPKYAFLCVGGEGPALDTSVLLDSVHCSGDMLELARILHTEQQAIIYLFALEHRYYGKSYPTFQNDHGDTVSPTTNENLRFLSSRQALADLQYFVETMNHQHHLLSNNTKWITFGGSYPGMLAAWARLLYPQIIHAAVSNSAPVQARLEFIMYNNRVSYDVQYETIGGSIECLATIVQGHEEISAMLMNSEYEEIAESFNVCNATSLQDINNARLFLGDGVIQIPAQSNDPSCYEPLCNIAKLCESILKEYSKDDSSQSSMHVLATIAKRQRALNNNTNCLTLDWNETLKELASPDVSEDGMRSWLWQTCTEFGFYQTCTLSSMCPYGRGYHPLGVDLDICQYAFGVDPESVRENVKRTLEYYDGGWNMNATRILSVNGDCDPWSALAMTNDRSSEELPAHWVKGASHHFWTHPVKDTDGPEVLEARLLIYEKVMQWLEEENDDGLVTAAGLMTSWE